MASIRKRKNSYQITVSNGRDSNGKQIIETAAFTPDPTNTERQNQKALDKFVFEFEQKVKDGRYLDGEKTSLKDFINKWLKEYALQQLKPTTYANYKMYIDNRIMPSLGHIKLTKLQPMQIQSFYNDLLSIKRLDGKEGSLSSGTVRKIHGILHSILSTVVKWQIIESNPCERVSIPKKDEKEDIIKYFTLEQTEVFLKALDIEYSSTYKAHTRIDDTGISYQVSEYQEKRTLPAQHKIFFYIALFGGLRRGEIIALQWEDVNFTTNSISVNKSTARVGHEQITKTPKTKTSNRELTLPVFVMQMLHSYKIEQAKYRLSIGDQWIGNNYLFIQ